MKNRERDPRDGSREERAETPTRGRPRECQWWLTCAIARARVVNASHTKASHSVLNVVPELDPPARYENRTRATSDDQRERARGRHRHRHVLALNAAFSRRAVIYSRDVNARRDSPGYI